MSVPPSRALRNPIAQHLHMLSTMSEGGMRLATAFRRQVLTAGRVTDQDIVIYARFVQSVRESIAMEPTLYGPRRRRRRRAAAEPDESLLGNLRDDLAKERGQRPLSKVLAEVNEALERIARQARRGGGDEPTAS